MTLIRTINKLQIIKSALDKMKVICYNVSTIKYYNFNFKPYMFFIMPAFCFR